MAVPNRKDTLWYPILFVFILWMIKLTEWILNVSFANYGILPREEKGLPGILLAPLLHANTEHLIYNTLPILILGILMFNFYRPLAFRVFFLVYGISDCLIWLAARSYYHIGASILIYGFIGFLVASGIFRKEFKAILISIVVLVLYGGALYGIFPTASSVSWEGHLFGCMVGIGTAYYFRNFSSRGNEKR
jgi:membrane associated rhomboid family serine protease